MYGPTTEPPEPLGRRIARLRSRLGWSQEDLAERLAASRVAVSHFEIGMAIPSERTIVLLAGLFKLEPDELIAGTNYPEAKAERLPAVACRYTELEARLLLLERDLQWAMRYPAERERVVGEWRLQLAELQQTAYNARDQALLHSAAEQLRRIQTASSEQGRTADS